MGSGKSTLGKKLASVMQLPFIDLDAEIEKAEGRTIGAIFSEEGENYFRRVEAEVLRTIRTDSGAVVATGGGVPCYGGNMDYMNANGVTVYLRMSPGALASRLAQSTHTRPLLSGKKGNDLLDYIEHKLREREPCYLKSLIVFDGLSADVACLREQISELERKG
jgi:shikimate kinase